MEGVQMEDNQNDALLFCAVPHHLHGIVTFYLELDLMKTKLVQFVVIH